MFARCVSKTKIIYERTFLYVHSMDRGYLIDDAVDVCNGPPSR